jgi:hypothetical protein
MGGDEQLGGRVRPVRVEVDHERDEHERGGRQRPSPGVELPPASEVPGEDRQHEQRDVPQQPVGFLVGEVSSEAGDLDRGGRRQGEDERLGPPAGRARWRVLIAQDELLPQPAPVLAGELSGQGVEVPHPLHGYEERLIGCETGRAQLGDLVAKMRVQLVDVAAVDGRGLGDVGPPLGDLCLHAVHAQAPPSAVGSQPGPRQTSPSARVTVTHCRC